MNNIAKEVNLIEYIGSVKVTLSSQPKWKRILLLKLAQG